MTEAEFNFYMKIEEEKKRIIKKIRDLELESINSIEKMRFLRYE